MLGSSTNHANIILILAVCRFGTTLSHEPGHTGLTAEKAAPTPAEMTRLDCIPEAGGGVDKVTTQVCQSRGCLYQPASSPQVPTCFHPPGNGYKLTNRTDTNLGVSLSLTRVGPFPFPEGIQNVRLDIEERANHLLRIKITDAGSDRYEVPVPLDLPETRATGPMYKVAVTQENPLTFQIIRRSTGTAIWDTRVGGLVLSNQFLQIATLLPSVNIYGFGENQHHSLRHDLNFTSWGLFGRDQPPAWERNSNLYGVHPFYTCVENDGNTHGVLILNSNAQEYSFTPAPMLTYRTIGGILDLYFFFGPEPETVIQQYTEVIGRPYMPPYWALGFQQSRYGYKDVAEVKAAVDRTRNAEIPLDVQYVDIDYMDERMDFTIDPVNFGTLADYFAELKSEGVRNIVILDPCFITNVSRYEPYDKIKAINASVKWPADFQPPKDSIDDGRALLGYVWPKGKVVFPDFFNPKTQTLWKNLIIKFREQVAFDGLWIDMNEPASFGTNEEKPFNWPEKDKPYWSLKCGFNNWDDPPYRPLAASVHDNPASSDVERQRAKLSDKTICMNTVQGANGEYKHYNVHNLFGWSQIPSTLEGTRAATKSRSIVISRSTFPGSGKYAGHWLGDNESSWAQLVYSIIGSMEFSMFGIPYIGADICGFMLNTTAELCTRWMQLGAFYTFSRNHNNIGSIPQDPAALGDDVASMSAKALRARYLLLPYLYTLFHKAHTQGSTVIRPLHHEFPKDRVALGVDRQFMWGPGLLISPIVEQGQTKLSMYFPPARWYDFYTGESSSDTGGETVIVPVGPRTHIPLHLRGGQIFPFQTPDSNTLHSRKNPLELMVALDKTGRASGDLFWDDGESVDTYENGQYLYATFNLEQNRLTVTIEHNRLPSGENLVFGGISVCGIQSSAVTEVAINDRPLDEDSYRYNLTSQVLSVFMNTTFGENMTVSWTLSDGSESVDCIPDIYNRTEKFSSTSKSLCLSRGCVWKTQNLSLNNGPSPCFMRAENGYEWTEVEDISRGRRYHLRKLGSSTIFGGDFDNAYLDVESYSNELVRLKFYPADTHRFTVPIDLNLPDVEITDQRYEFIITNYRPFSFQIIRRSTGTVIWDTGMGGLVLSDQFLQIATRLPSRNIYGLGENNHVSFRHDLDYKSWGVFARDQPPGWGETLNLYGVHPFYTCMENDGNSHGVLLLNSNAQDYTFSPLPMLTYRTIGGILDFYFFLGPDPESVVQQYTGMIGRPVLPPYWGLGFQLSRYNYTGTDDVRATVDRNHRAGIYQDIQYVDIDYMNQRLDFTVDDVNFAGLNDYFKQLQSQGMRVIIILDPCIISNWTNYEPYEKFKQAGANVKWPSGVEPPSGSADDDRSIFGYVWPQGKVIFPDFFRNVSRQIWIDQIVKFRHTVTFDGLWIDMNEPANFGTNEDRPFNWPPEVKPYWSLKCGGNKYDNPPYKTVATYTHDTAERTATLPDKTICLTTVQGESGEYRHYDVHNLYGWSQTPPTLKAARLATGERSLVVTRSTFPGSGQYAGHWLGDNESTWEQLRASIVGILEMNLFGIPYTGADICGFLKVTTRELCLRWMQLGAFYTFSRNHNGESSPPQDPAAFDEDFQMMSRDALHARYLLLPYLYTLFYNAHVSGNTVIRPLHHEFPTDPNTWSINSQFMWGRSLLICPILYQGQTEITFYLPKARWYDYYTGHLMSAEGGDSVTLPVKPNSKIPLYFRGGSIVPVQEPNNNTNLSRKNPVTFYVMLDRFDDDGGAAEGELFWDDGSSIDTIENKQYYFSKLYSKQQSVEMFVQRKSPSVSGLTVNEVHISGVNKSVDRVTVRTSTGVVTHTEFVYQDDEKVLGIRELNLKLEEDFRIEWSHLERRSLRERRSIRTIRESGTPDAEKIDCLPDSDKLQGSLEYECRTRNCIWESNHTASTAPVCFIDNRRYGYQLIKVTQTAAGTRFDLRKRSTVTMFGDDSDVIQLDFEMWSDSAFRLKFHDPNNPYRYEVPVSLSKPTSPVGKPLYTLKHGTTNQGFFYIQVIRQSSNKVIWDTSLGGLIFSEQFLQLSTKLPSSDIYGFGENRHASFRHNMDYKEWPMFSRSENPGEKDFANLYSVHPFYTCMEDAIGNSHGVLLLNSNAQEYVFHPVPSLTYRTTGGILDFYFFMGPEPDTVVQQYTEVVGRPIMPPYWGLGFQLSRWGYTDVNSMKAVHDRMVAANIPYDVQYADIDYMDERKSFTYDSTNFAGLPDFIKALHNEGMRFVIILNPGIVSNVSGYRPYDLGRQHDIFIKWPVLTSPDFSEHQTDDMLGYVWPKGKSVFPDFLNPKARDVWKQLIAEQHKTLEFDGLWLDMNEPANFGTNQERPANWPEKDKPYWSLKCPKSKWDDPAYKPRSVLGDRLSDGTLCMVGLQNDGHREYRHYDVHSLYGFSEALSTLQALQEVTKKRSVVVSRSTFPGSGRHGPHWLGDNVSKWPHLKDSIIGILEFNLFGIPYVGADICGFFGDAETELCERWVQLGAFYTFSRSHNEKGAKDQDPASFGPEVAYSSRRALQTRYRMLPYLYTLFFRAHVDGSTVIRPVMHEYPSDARARDLDTQFLWGPALMIAPVLEQGHSTKDVYFPADVWYDYRTGMRVENVGQSQTVSAPRDVIPMYLRGGYIIPTQQPGINTHVSQLNPMGMIIATDAAGFAQGELYLDDGISINATEDGQYWLKTMIFQKNELHVFSHYHFDNYNLPIVDTLRILGVQTEPKVILKDGEMISSHDFRYYFGSKVLDISNLGLSYASNFTVTIQ